MATSGLIQTPSQMEVRYGKFTRVTRGLSRVLWGVAAVAAVVAAAASFLLRRRLVVRARA